MDINTQKDLKEAELSKEKEERPFIQVDKQGNVFSNFISNFKREFKKARGFGLGRLFGGNPEKNKKKDASPPDIMGPAKSSFHISGNEPKGGKPMQKDKTNRQKLTVSIRQKQAWSSNKKPRQSL